MLTFSRTWDDAIAGDAVAPRQVLRHLWRHAERVQPQELGVALGSTIRGGFHRVDDRPMSVVDYELGQS